MNTTGKKFGGRKKGTLNKLIQDSKMLIKKALENNYEKFLENMDRIDNPGEYCNIYLKALSFVIPKPKQLDANIDDMEQQKKRVAELFPFELQTT